MPDAEQVHGWADWEIRRAIEATTSENLKRELQAELDYRAEYRRGLPAFDPSLREIFPGSS